MKKAIFSMLLLAGSVSIYAQDKGKLIADETTVSDTKTSFKIETCNDAIFKRITGQFQTKLTRYMVTYKKDRKGPYSEYVLYFKPEDKAAIVSAVSKY